MPTMVPLLLLASIPVFGATSASAQQCPLRGWEHASIVTVKNEGGRLEHYQVRIDLDESSIDFRKARADGGDVRLTMRDGGAAVPFWIERWDPVANKARIWARVASVQDGAELCLSYQNSNAPSVSNGNETFLFFDDFAERGYFKLSGGQTVLWRKPGTFERSAPHTLSVVQVQDHPAYPYWGYYGPSYWATEASNCPPGCEQGWVGLVRSRDLVNWERDEHNPLPQLHGSRERWPSVLLVDGKFYMAYTRNYLNPSDIVLRTSTDGIHFVDPLSLVEEEKNFNNQNPALFQDPADGKFYLYWFRQGTPAAKEPMLPKCAPTTTQSAPPHQWQIWVKKASSVDALRQAPCKKILARDVIIAAPQVMFYDGIYYLAVETRSRHAQGPDEKVWYTLVFWSTRPDEGFKLLPGNPVLGDGSGCFFQHIFGSTLHAYYCKQTPPDVDQGKTWTIDHRTADLTAGRVLVAVAGSGKWPDLGSDGGWKLVSSVLNRYGSEVVVVQGETTAKPYQILRSSFDDGDYVVEASGRQIVGRVWGIGVRVSGTSLYSVNVYNDLYPASNLYLYRWEGGSTPLSGGTSIGKIESGTWIQLTVKVHSLGSRSAEIEVYVNDEKKLSVEDSDAIPSGKVALYGEPGTTAQFSNVFVRKYAAIEPSVSIRRAN